MKTCSNPGPRRNLYQEVTQQILEDLERGVRPWTKSWKDGEIANAGLPLRHNGVPYQGVNILLLWSCALKRGFRASTWMTYRQAQTLGGQVRRGEGGTQVVYADQLVRTDTEGEDTDTERVIPFLKCYTVFNVEQIKALPARYHPDVTAAVPREIRQGRAEAFLQATRAQIHFGGAHAFYRPSTDTIHLPPPEAFYDGEGYYSTALHELTHWSGAPSRCARELSRRFGSEAYALEELIAELGAAFLCAELGVSATVREDHAAYLASWLQVLKADHRAVFTAAALAQRAADYLRSLQSSTDGNPP